MKDVSKAIRDSSTTGKTITLDYTEEASQRLAKSCTKSHYRKSYVVFYGENWTVKLKYPS